MSGTLHIFRLKSNPVEFQVNYNLGSATWVKVFDNKEIDHFLRHDATLAEDQASAVLKELSESGRSTLGAFRFHEPHLAEMGFSESPSEG